MLKKRSIIMSAAKRPPYFIENTQILILHCAQHDWGERLSIFCLVTYHQSQGCPWPSGQVGT